MLAWSWAGARACARRGVRGVVAALSAAASVAHTAPVAYVAATDSGNDKNDGKTPTSAVATVNRGAAIAAAAGGGEVAIASGEYDGLIALPVGVTLVGGYSADFKATKPPSSQEMRSNERASGNYTGTRLLNRAGERVINAMALSSSATLRNLIVIGPDQRQPGWSSSAIVVNGPGTLSLDGVKVIAGNGGSSGPATPSALATTFCSAGGEGGKGFLVGGADGEFHHSTDCAPGAFVCGHYIYCGSNGGQTGGGRTEAPGGGGGQAGNSYCDSWGSNSNGEDGKPGAPGTPAPPGPGGVANPNHDGTFVLAGDLLAWRAQPGGDGVDGPSGGGGGGGGAGGSARAYWWVCTSRTMLGGTGGTGGRGGCGGGGGRGGGTGGGSFGLVVKDATIDAVWLTILQGRGGDGGAGGAGGKGAPGQTTAQDPEGRMKGKAGDGPSHCSSWWYTGTGGDGGPGAAGGQGGGGAGGNGGPSIGIALIDKGRLERKRFRSIGGKGGTAGDGAAVHGAPGKPGLAANEKSFSLTTP